MLSFEQYKRMLKMTGSTMGQALKAQSDIVMEATWDRDIQSRVGYIYDYYHDDSVTSIRGFDPTTSKTKTPVEIKFIVTQYGSLSKDQVEYHIQFKPSHKCALDYYAADYDNRYGMEYPLGMYIDIPDESGVYRKWLICSRDHNPQFIKYSVLPCNYTFRWVLNGQLYVMDAVARLRNSYNSGVWTDYLTTTVENQDQMWLPLNKVSATIYYDQRFLISPPIPNPTAWRVTKIETLHPFGIYKVVVAQDLFDEHKDLVDLERKILIADYFESKVTPSLPNKPPESEIPATRFSIEASGKTNQLKIGGHSRTYRLAVWDEHGNKIPHSSIPNFPQSFMWMFTVGDEDVSEKLEIEYAEDVSVSVRTNDLSLLSTVLKISAYGQSGHESDDAIGAVAASKEVEVVGL